MSALNNSSNNTPAKKTTSRTELIKTPASAKKQVKQTPQKDNTPNKMKRKQEGSPTPPKKIQKFSGTLSSDASEKTPAKTPNKVSPSTKARKEKGEKRTPIQQHIVELVKTKGKDAVIADLTRKMETLQKKKTASHSMKRKLRLWKRLIKSLGGAVPEAPPSKTGEGSKKAQKRRNRKKLSKDNKEQPDTIEARSQKAKRVKKTSEKKVEKVAEDSAEESSESETKEVEAEESDESEEVDSGEEGSDDESEDNEDESEEESTEKNNEKTTKPLPVAKQNGQAKQKKEIKIDSLKQNDLMKKGQSRYVVFVGNLAFETSKDQLKEHFSKVGEIVDIRIPTHAQNNKPKGFAYVEVSDEASYQKALSLHHTFINDRRINVEYTQGGTKKSDNQKKEIKAKNFKLHAMRKEGQLQGSTKQTNKRSFRRGKANAGGGKSD